MTSEQLAQLFHDHYERLAPEFGYTSRGSSAVPWQEVPEPNKSLMIATAKMVMRDLGLEEKEVYIEERIFWPPPREDLEEGEASHPWAHKPLRFQADKPEFDWDKERERQKREGPLYEETEEERKEREWSILP